MNKAKKLDWGCDAPITKAAQWIEGFLNDMDGDFCIVSERRDQIILKNKSSCPGFCSAKAGNTKTCDDIEIAICVAIKSFDPDLDADFVCCSNDGDSSCQINVRSVF